MSFGYVTEVPIFNFWKLKMLFKEMFYKSLQKQFRWNLMLRYTVKLTLN